MADAASQTHLLEKPYRIQTESSRFFHSRRGPAYCGLFVTRSFSYKPGFFWARRLFDGQELEATRVDARASSHVEDSRKKENTCGKYRQNTQANRRCDTAKGVQHGIVTRLAGLRVAASPVGDISTQAPAKRGAFFRPLTLFVPRESFRVLCYPLPKLESAGAVCGRL